MKKTQEEDKPGALHHLLQVQEKKILVKKLKRKMYLHSNKYDRSCALALIVLANTIAPASTIAPTNTIASTNMVVPTSFV
jgi:hypothetical protein